MKMLIACEYSGEIRDAFLAKGHDVTSCDLLPTERPGPHYQGDVRDIINDPWDMIIAHPDCRFICNSGVRWLTNNPDRWYSLRKACGFFCMFLYHKCPKIVIENPVPHKHAMKYIGLKYNQIIHPWQHGHGETKSTCLWIKGVPELKPTEIVEGREQRIWKMPPSKDRSKLRAKTFSGIATAMAEQWG